MKWLKPSKLGWIIIGSVVAVMIFLFVACSPEPKAEKYTLDHIQTWGLLFDSGLLKTNGSCISVNQSLYELPSREWVENELVPVLKSAYSGLTYENNALDCDFYSANAQLQARLLHYKDPKRAKNTGILFGEIGYIKEGVGGHAINILVVKGKEKCEILFFEPQNLKFVTLSEKELKTIQRIIL